MVVNLGFTKMNYTGPYISDGKFQTSVEFGKSKPLNRLDAFSRYHDSAFAHYKDYGHRTAANSIYYDQTRNGNKTENFAGNVVLYGNQVKSALGNMPFGVGNFPGLIYGGIKNLYNLADYVHNRNKYRKEVLAYYKTDPQFNHAEYNPSLQSGGKELSGELGLGGRRPGKIGPSAAPTSNPTSTVVGEGSEPVDSTLSEGKRSQQNLHTIDEYGGGRSKYNGLFLSGSSSRSKKHFKRRHNWVYSLQT